MHHRMPVHAPSTSSHLRAADPPRLVRLRKADEADRVGDGQLGGVVVAGEALDRVERRGELTVAVEPPEVVGLLAQVANGLRAVELVCRSRRGAVLDLPPGLVLLVAWRVLLQEATRPQDAVQLTQRLLPVGHVFQHVQHNRPVQAVVLQRDPLQVGLHRGARVAAWDGTVTCRERGSDKLGV